jgi:hypothetical protein
MRGSKLRSFAPVRELEGGSKSYPASSVIRDRGAGVLGPTERGMPVPRSSQGAERPDACLCTEVGRSVKW